MLKKFKEWIGTGLDVYKVENANDIAPGLVRHIWKGEETATQIGTTLKAQIMNDLQKGLVHTLNTTRTTGMNKDIYEAVLGGIEEFGVFDGLKLLTRIDRENQYDDVFLRLGGVEYPIYKIKENTVKKLNKGDLKEKKEYLLNYNNNFFVLSDSVLYGTQPDTVLEGNRLAEIIGMEFGGKIQDSGIKTAGKFYYDIVTKFYYECIVNNSLTYNDSSKFRAISNKPISDRLENLFKFQKSQTGSLKFGGIEIKWGIVPDGSATLVFPKPFDNACLSIQLTRLGKPVNDTTGSGASGASTILAIYRTHFDVDSVIGDRDKSELTYLAIGYWDGNM